MNQRIQEKTHKRATRFTGLLRTAGIGVLTAALLIALLPFPAGVQAASTDYRETTVSYNGKSFSVQFAAVDLTDPFLRVMPVTASGGVGRVEDFGSMMKRTGAVVGVNGTFFDAYENDESVRYPNGLMVRSGGIVRTGGNQALVVDTNKRPTVIKALVQVSATVRQPNGGTYTFEPWGVNTYYGTDNPSQIVCYTPDFRDGKVTFPGGTKVAVDEDGSIVQVTEGDAVVPDEGYVIFVGNTEGNRTYVLSQIRVGERMDVTPKFTNQDDGTPHTAQEWEAAIGVGPKLITDGRIDVDPKRDGFSDPKITSGSNVRSFVGVDAQNRLVMGTTSAATVYEMANVLQQLGLTDAMNMDGGASSGLYYNGSVKRTPGRKLSNALIVKRYDVPQVQVAVNGSFVNEFRGFLRNDKTMAPIRGILERIQADFKWDGGTETLTIQKGGTRIALKPEQATAVVNGNTVKLDAAATMIDGHIYLPLRFVAETLGATVSWDDKLWRANVTIH